MFSTARYSGARTGSTCLRARSRAGARHTGWTRRPDMSGSALGAASRWTKREVAQLYPGSFAFVMATGIVSNAFFFEEHRAIAGLLFAVNLVAFPLLLLATLLRLFGFGARLWRDLLDPRLVFSFFTVVAASDVFGVQLDLRGYSGAALALWLFALGAWLSLSYVSF